MCVCGERAVCVCVEVLAGGGVGECGRVGGLAHEQDGVGGCVPVGLEVAVLGHEGGAFPSVGREEGPDALEVRPHGGRAFHVNMFIS